MSIADLSASDAMAWESALDTLEYGTDKHHRARRQLLTECPTPADLAVKFDPTFVRTEAGDLISARIVDAMTTYDGRLTVSQPPQTGKSLTLRWTCLWLLLRDPNTRIVFASYAERLARTSGRIIRSLVETHGEPYGLRLDKSHADAADWQIEGYLGGVYAVGTGSSLTGRAASAMIVDDPHPSMQAADSASQRGNVLEWWSSTARTRLAPGAPVVGVATRWSEFDLISMFIGDGWPSINIPAQADGKTPDALNRPAGEYLVTPRDTTPADWVKTRAEAGERTWASLYQGRPAPLEGGIFKRDWFTTWRVSEAPAGCLPPTVVVDPADNEGDGDEAGIIVATSHPVTGKVYLLDDLSGSMTVARWARVALLTCVRRSAPTLAYERSLSQLPKRIREAWQQLHQQAVALRRADYSLSGALIRLTRPDDPREAIESIRSGISEILDDVDGILAFGETGPRLKPIIAKGSKSLRMQLVAPMFETGRAVFVGHHPLAEHQLATWLPGQDSPDRADACFIAGTLILTKRGEIPIECIRAGELVWTRKGWRRVTAASLSRRAASLVTVRISNGRTLTGTPDHRVWVVDRGWCRLDSLVRGDTLTGWTNPPPQLCSKAFDISGTLTGSNVLTAFTITRHEGADAKRCIEMCGAQHTQASRYPMGGIFITEMKTHSITTHRTLYCYHMMTICARMQADHAARDCGFISARFDPSQYPGIRAQKEPLGIVATGETAGEAVNLDGSSALNADLDSRAGSLGSPDAAPLHALPSCTVAKIAISTWFRALYATRNSLKINTERVPRHAAVHVVNSYDRREQGDVYDLAVADVHEFVASGVIVHNCVHAVSTLGGQPESKLERSTERLPTNSTSLRNGGTSRIVRSTRR